MLMRTRFLLSLAVFLTSAALAQAQSNALPPPAEVVDIRPEEALWSVPGDPNPGPYDRFWMRADYLLWWVRSGPVNTPLVTTGSPLDPVPGALGQGGTAALFGGTPLNYGTFSGFRLGAGFDLISGFGLEAGYFALERRAAGFAAVSDASGNPLIARPVFNNQGPGENAYLYSLPDTASGSVTVLSQTHLQGGDLNLTANVYQGPSVRFTVLAGFRMVELDESLNITGNVTPLVPGFLTFLGGPADPPFSLTDFDSFKVQNKFYGGQFGGRLTWRGGPFELGLLGKLALGSTQELVFINGFSALNSPGNAPVTNPGGLLTQPSNIGRYYHSSFGVIPELGLNLGYCVTPQFKVTFGYSFLYWNRVARPGNQIDRTVSAAQVARDPNFGSSVSDLRPLFQVHESDFWAQGINFGIEFQF
jgi:hypothetical protein